MNPSNRPTVEAPAAGAPPRTYADVVAGRNLKRHEVAYAWTQAEPEVEVGEMWGPTVAAKLDTVNTQAHVKELVGRYGDSLVPLQFLTIHETKVKVLYGWRVCRPMDAEGRRFAALLNDRNGNADCLIPPKLVITREGAVDRQYQYQTFQRTSANAKSIDDIVAALAANEDWQLVPAAEQEEGGPAPEVVNVWRVLPVHPKVAALFTRGLSIRDAISVAKDLYSSLPESARDRCEGLLEYLRVAATIGTENRSALEAPWVIMDPAANASLEAWYVQLCQAYAPLWSPAVPATRVEPPPPTAVPDPSPAAAKDALKRPYTTSELRKLFRVCGLESLEDGDMVSENLPEFWRGFERARAKMHSAREYIESWLDGHWPPNEPQYQHFVSTSLIQSLVALDFNGGDLHLHPSKRQCGLSVYSVYPLADSADLGAERDRSRAYEDTMDNHRPGEREIMGQLSSFAKDTPGERTEFRRWAQYFRAWLEVIFGHFAIQLPILRRMEETLATATPFRYLRPQDFQGYYWKYHCAVRRSFLPSREHEPNTQPFTDLLFRMRQGMPFSPQEVPGTLQDSGHKRNGEPLPNGGPARQERDKRPKRSGAEISGVTKTTVDKIIRAIGPKIKEASEAMERVGKRLNSRTMFPSGLDPAFGAILPLVKATEGGSRSPCPRVFLYGKCTVANCRASHELTRAPPDGAIKHYVDWVEAKCAEIKANPNA